MLRGKRILIGITGGIAAYKSCYIIRELRKLGAEVFVVMTRSAAEFITPLTLRTLSGNQVYQDMFEKPHRVEVVHIGLADRADLILVCPATANMIGKVSGGIADDLLSTTIMATGAKVLFAPAMNDKMYNNPIVRENISKLKELGYCFTGPGEGELACGVSGSGRLEDEDIIIDEVIHLLHKKDFTGKKILITASCTREPIDKVRFISNYSTGKMGYSIAKEASLRGALVTLVSGPSALSPPRRVNIINVGCAEEMFREVKERIKECDIFISSAAVGDARPAELFEVKVKKDKLKEIRLIENPDILGEMGRCKGTRILVGFCVESEDLLRNARMKLHKKNLDLIVANDVRGFAGDTDRVILIDKNGKEEEFPELEKREIARKLMDRIYDIMH